MRFGLPGGIHGRGGVAAGAIEEDIQEHGGDRGQQDTGFDQRVDGMRHPLAEVGRHQRHHAHADGHGHDHGVEAVGLEIDRAQDADAGGRHHAEHHQARAAQHHGGQRFDQRRHLGHQASRMRIRPPATQTKRLLTPVTATRPTFCEKLV